MTQFLNAASIVASGSWQNTTIGNLAADDNAYCVSEVQNNAPSTTFEVALDAGTDPAVSTGHVIRCIWKADTGGGANADPICELVQGSTIIATLTGANVVTTEVEATYTLTGTEADSITDYTDLRLRLRTSNHRREFWVELARFEIPDASGTNYDNTGGVFTITSAVDNPVNQYGMTNLGGVVTAAATVDNPVNLQAMQNLGGVVSVASTVENLLNTQAMQNLGGEFTIVSTVTGNAGQFFVNLGGEVVVVSEITNGVNTQAMSGVGGVVEIAAAISAAVSHAMENLGGTVGIVSILSSFQDYVPSGGGPPPADVALSVKAAVLRVFESEDHEDSYLRGLTPRVRSS